MASQVPPPPPEKLKIAGIYVVWNNRLLIHKRSDKAGSEASWHKFASPGGKVDPEDRGSFRKAALRELSEETGLSGRGRGHRLYELQKTSSPGADSVMYFMKLSEKPEVSGPDQASKKSFDMSFDFAAEGVKGEVAGPGYFWAELPDLLAYLKTHPKYSNPYFIKNVQKLKRKLVGARKTRKSSTS